MSIMGGVAWKDSHFQTTAAGGVLKIGVYQLILILLLIKEAVRTGEPLQIGARIREHNF